MTKALSELFRALRDGIEFPDAQSKVSLAFDVNPDELRDAYDEACAARTHHYHCGG